MRVRTKIIILLLSIALVFSAATVTYMFFEKYRLQVLIQDEKNLKAKTFNKIMELDGASLYTFTYDYTYWDEMAEFVEAKTGKLKGEWKSATPVEEWGANNIDVSLYTFNAQTAWIYDKDLNLVYSATTLEDENIKKGIPAPIRQVAGKLFPGKKRFCHFFVYTPEGLLEIRGATIHWGSDEKREKEPVGYFFVGRLWSEDHVKRISNYADADIGLHSLKKIEVAHDAGSGMYSFKRVLYGWDGTPVAHLDVYRESVYVRDFERSFHQIFFAIIYFGTVVLLSFLFFMFRWVDVPLAQISKTLEKEDTSFISGLQKSKSEFGNIAKLIDKFFKQQGGLVKEIAHREEIEKKLQANLQELENFKRVTVGREMKMVELKKEINKLSEELGRPAPYEKV